MAACYACHRPDAEAHVCDACIGLHRHLTERWSVELSKEIQTRKALELALEAVTLEQWVPRVQHQVFIEGYLAGARNADAMDDHDPHALRDEAEHAWHLRQEAAKQA